MSGAMRRGSGVSGSPKPPQSGETRRHRHFAASAARPAFTFAYYWLIQLCWSRFDHLEKSGRSACVGIDIADADTNTEHGNGRIAFTRIDVQLSWVSPAR